MMRRSRIAQKWNKNSFTKKKKKKKRRKISVLFFYSVISGDGDFQPIFSPLRRKKSTHQTFLLFTLLSVLLCTGAPAVVRKESRPNQVKQSHLSLAHFALRRMRNRACARSQQGAELFM